MTFFKEYWPALAVGSWLFYKWLRTFLVKKRLPELLKRGAVCIDVRSPGEFATGHAEGSINIPLQEISQRVKEIPVSGPVIVGCASGTRSGMAAMILKKNGFREVYNIGSWTHFPKG